MFDRFFYQPYLRLRVRVVGVRLLVILRLGLGMLGVRLLAAQLRLRLGLGVLSVRLLAAHLRLCGGSGVSTICYHGISHPQNRV